MSWQFEYIVSVDKCLQTMTPITQVLGLKTVLDPAIFYMCICRYTKLLINLMANILQLNVIDRIFLESIISLHSENMNNNAEIH